MKSCVLCGTEAADDATVCANTDCGRRFASSGGAESAAASLIPVDQRPNGQTPMMIGWFALLAAIGCVLWALTKQSALETAYLGARQVGYSPISSGLAESSAVSAAETAGQIAQLHLLGGAFFGLFLFLWSVGYIVRAISFLPGKEA